MLARLLRWLLLAQVLTGALLGWLVGYASGFASPTTLGLALGLGLLLPLLTNALTVTSSLLKSRPVGSGAAWWRAATGELAAALRGDTRKGLFFRGVGALPFGSEIRSARALTQKLLVPAALGAA